MTLRREFSRGSVEHSGVSSEREPTARERVERLLNRLRGAPYLMEREGGFAVRKDAYEALCGVVSGYRSAYEVPLEYPRTELYLAALLGDAAEMDRFVQRVGGRDSARALYQSTQQGLDNLGRRHALRTSDHPLAMHDTGRGLPPDIKPFLSGKKILFVGGGSMGSSLLGRFFSDGATAVNVDFYAQGYAPDGWTGPAVDRRGEYDADTARALGDAFGSFDGIVIQNVIDCGAVDRPPLVKSLLEGLATNLSKDGVLILQVDSVGQDVHDQVTRSLTSQGLAPAFPIEAFGGNRGRCHVYVRE